MADYIIYSESPASEYPSVKERINKQETLGYSPLVNQTERKHEIYKTKGLLKDKHREE